MIAGPPMTSDHTPGLRSPLVALGTRGAPVTPLTFEHVHHAEEGEREGGLPTACAATDPNLERGAGTECLGKLLVLALGCAGTGGHSISCPAFLTSFYLARAGPRLWACFLGPEGPPTGTRKQVQGVDVHLLGLGVGLAVPGTWLQGSWGPGAPCMCAGVGGGPGGGPVRSAATYLCAPPYTGVTSDPIASRPMGTNKKDNKGPVQRQRW